MPPGKASTVRRMGNDRAPPISLGVIPARVERNPAASDTPRRGTPDTWIE